MLDQRTTSRRDATVVSLANEVTIRGVLHPNSHAESSLPGNIQLEPFKGRNKAGKNERRGTEQGWSVRKTNCR